MFTLAEQHAIGPSNAKEKNFQRFGALYGREPRPVRLQGGASGKAQNAQRQERNPQASLHSCIPFHLIYYHISNDRSQPRLFEFRVIFLLNY